MREAEECVKIIELVVPKIFKKRTKNVLKQLSSLIAQIFQRSIKIKIFMRRAEKCVKIIVLANYLKFSSEEEKNV